MSGSTEEYRAFKVVPAPATRVGGELQHIVLYKADGTAYPIPTKQAAQADTVAADLAALKVDFNLLLAKLRLAGILT